MSEKLPCIYCLYDHDWNPIYIGKANDAKKRLAGHMRDAKRRNYPISRWIRANGLPNMRVVLKDSSDWPTHERQIISAMRQLGVQLLNVSAGGNEPHISLVSSAENGRRNAKAIHSDPVRKRLWKLKQQLGLCLKKGWYNPALLDKMRARPDLFGELMARAGLS